MEDTNGSCEMWNYLDGLTMKPELIANNQESKTAMDKWTK